MKTKANQSAAERNITMVALADIQPSGFNPRKRFDETSLYELADVWDCLLMWNVLQII